MLKKKCEFEDTFCPKHSRTGQPARNKGQKPAGWVLLQPPVSPCRVTSRSRQGHPGSRETRLDISCLRNNVARPWSLQKSWCYKNTGLKREGKIPTLITTGGRNRVSNLGGKKKKIARQQQKSFQGIRSCISDLTGAARGRNGAREGRTISQRNPGCRNEETHPR